MPTSPTLPTLGSLQDLGIAGDTPKPVPGWRGLPAWFASILAGSGHFSNAEEGVNKGNRKSWVIVQGMSGVFGALEKPLSMPCLPV
jgi:hypothetical protein